MNPLQQKFQKLAGLVRNQNLLGRILRGGAIVGAGSTVEHAFRFARNLILTRLLMPEALGTMAIILAVNAALESFTEVGIRESVVSYPQANQKPFLNAVWLLAAGRGLILFILGCILAPFLGSFYHMPHYTGLFMLSFTTMIFNGAISSKTYLALKKMQYGKWVAIMQGGALIGISLTLLLVWLGWGVKALVFGYVAEAISKFILSFILCPFMPGTTFDKEHSSYLSKFTKSMAGVPLLTFLFLQADIFVLGKMVSKSDVGLYGMAASLAGIPAIVIAVFINPILMPAFAEMKEQGSRINNALLRATGIMSLIGFPFCAWAWLCGSDIMHTVYGSAYASVGTVFALLICTTMLRTMASPIPAIYLGIGQPALNRLFTILRAIAMIAIIYPAIRFWGLKGAAVAGGIAMSISWIFQVWRMTDLTGLSKRLYALQIGSGLIGAGIVIAIGFVIKIFIHTSTPAMIAIGIVTALVAGISAAYALHNSLDLNLI
jgi:O-antigen/teichoic acid export membrane protein